MDNENRNHPRFRPNGLNANISIDPPPPDEEIVLEGKIVDMSYTGIKIKLTKPIDNNLPTSEIKINLTMPESGVPVSIHGIIKHINEKDECGLEYSKKHQEQDVDDLMFECIKVANDHTQD